MKKAVSLIASLILLACVLMPEHALCSWVSAAEENSSAASTVDEIAEQFADPSNDPFGYRDRAEMRKALKLAENEYPASFDLRNVDTDGDGKGDTSFVTPVKLQYPFGTCWGFAAISAAETSILADPELSRDHTVDELDLSEKHIAYFAATALDDPESPQNGEGRHEESIAERLNTGGHAYTATSLFSSGIGPVLESCGEEFRYRGAYGWTEKSWIGNRYQNVWYLENDDWSLPEELRFSQSYRLRESYMLPTPNGVDKSGEYRYDPAGTAAIKEQLINRRAVQIGYRADNFDPDTQEHGELLSENWAQYSPLTTSANHAVCIVGWDDNYDKNNFIDGQEPPENGAWLIKNSWGSEEEEFPNHGEGKWGMVDPDTGKHTGYFWLSYYDQTMDIPEAVVFDEKSEDPAYRIDQHDFMPVDEVLGARLSSKISMANVFRPAASERLESVSFQTCYPGTEVTVEIYLLPEEYNKPTDGVLMDTETASFENGGYHKLDLKHPFIVMKGQPYAIVVTQKTTGEQYIINVQAAMNAGGADDPTMKGVINEGESLVLLDGKWQDLSDKKLQKSLMKKAIDDIDNMAIDNFPIKAYGKELPNLSLYVEESGILDVSEPGWDPTNKYLALHVRGDSAAEVPEDIKVTWTLEEGGEKVVDMTDGRDRTRKVLVAKKCGKTNLLIAAEGIGTLVYPIDISPSFTDILKLTSGKKKLTVTINDLLWRGVDGYQVKYRIKGKKSWKVKELSPSEVKVSKNKNVFVLRNLKKGRKYQVRVRPWADTARGRYYGVFSAIKLSGKIK